MDHPKSATVRYAAALGSIPARYKRRAFGGANAALDGVRFLAILVVVVGHLAARVYQLPDLRAAFGETAWTLFLLTLNQSVGVLLFFMISGFVTALQIDRHSESGRRKVSYFAFLGRRIWRIAPPYCLVVLCAFVAMVVFGIRPKSITAVETGIHDGILLLVSLLYSYGWLFDGYPKYFVAGWSLEIEMQFYVLAPLLVGAVFALWRSSLGRAALLGVVIAWALLAASPAGSTPHLRFTLVRYGVYFFVGAALYLAFKSYDLPARLSSALRERAGLRHGADALSLGALAAFFLIQPPYDAFWGGRASMLFVASNLVCMVVVFVAALVPGTRLNRFCANDHVSFLGSICYSIYLTHMFVIYFVGSVMAKAAASIGAIPALLVLYTVGTMLIVGVGFAFYVVVERIFIAPPGRAPKPRPA